MTVKFVPIPRPDAADEHYVIVGGDCIGTLTWQTGIGAGWWFESRYADLRLGDLNLSVSEAISKAEQALKFMELK